MKDINGLIMQNWSVPCLQNLQFGGRIRGRNRCGAPEESNVVGLAGQTEGSSGPAGADGLPPDLGHDVALAPQVLVAQAGGGERSGWSKYLRKL